MLKLKIAEHAFCMNILSDFYLFYFLYISVLLGFRLIVFTNFSPFFRYYIRSLIFFLRSRGCMRECILLKED